MTQDERDVLAELVAQLALEKIEENLFRGQSQDLGWGTVFGLGCTVGTLLSGISAGAVSGWVFALGLIVGTTVTLKAARRLRLLD